MESVEKIAEVLLYEGYLLYPYRRSALKNQQRWTFGGVYPRAFSEEHGDDPWHMQTQCLIVGDAATTLEVAVRYLQVVDRRVATIDEGGDASGARYVDELRVGDRLYRPWEEAMEREVRTAPLRLGDPAGPGWSVEIAVAAGRAEEPLREGAGRVAGTLVREWRSLRGTVQIAAEPVGPGFDEAHPGRGCYRLTIGIENTTPWAGPLAGDMLRPRDAALRQTLISTHSILRVQDGAFVSLLEPPEGFGELAAQCQNIKTWPVLVGEPGERHTMLSSPIILYDYPQVAPESQGNFFDTTEIDELLTLSVMTLTDAEKQEMRESDALAREILERTEGLSPEQILQLHGAIRGRQGLRREAR